MRLFVTALRLDANLVLTNFTVLVSHDLRSSEVRTYVGGRLSIYAHAVNYGGGGRQCAATGGMYVIIGRAHQWTGRLRGKQQCHSRTDTRRLDLPIGLESLQRGSDPNGGNGRDPAVDQEVCPDHVRRLVRNPAAKIKQWLAFARCPIRVAQGIGNVLWPMTFRRREA